MAVGLFIHRACRVESGSDNLGQVGLIHELNYLYVIRISHFFRKQCWHLVSEETLGLMNSLKYIIGVKPAYYIKLF